MGLRSRISSFFSRNASDNSEARSYIYDLKGKNPILDFNDTSVANVTERNSLRIATVYTCIAVRRDAVGMLPMHVFREKGNAKTINKDHPAHKAVNRRPNDWQTATQFWGLMVQNVDLHGDGFAEIVREPGSIKLIPLDHDHVTVKEGLNDGRPFYNYKGREIPAANMLHFKEFSLYGKVGLSKISEHRETIGSAKKQKEFANRSLNAAPPFYATTPNNVNVNTEGVNSLKQKFKEQTQAYLTEGTVPLLTNGIELKTIGLKPIDAAYLEQINATKEDIFGIFRVPPAIGGSYKSGVTFNNLEQQNLQFLIYTLSPLLKNFEEEVNEKLFTTQEQRSYYVKFNINALLRSDLKSRAEWYQTMFNIGVYSRNDIRQFEDLNPVQDGDRYYVQGNNMVPVDRIDEMIGAASGTRKKEPISEELRMKLKEAYNGKSDELITRLERL